MGKNPPNYRIVRAGHEETPQILDFMLQDFLRTEPLNESVDLTADEAREFFTEIINAGLSFPLNYVAKNNAGEIVALRWGCIIRRHDFENDYTFDGESPNWKVREIQRLLSTIEKKIWDVVPAEVDTLISWLVVSVRNDFTRRGIARELLEYGQDELRSIGCQGFIATASAFNSQNLFTKLGYDELYAIEHANWTDDNGKRIFQCHDQTSKVSLHLKLF